MIGAFRVVRPFFGGSAHDDAYVVIKARTLTFHVDSQHLPRLIKVVADIGERMSRRPDFRGLVCLDHDSLRHEITVLSLWDGHGLEDTQGAFDKARDQIADTIDLGMRSSEHRVLCLVPGAFEDHKVVPALAS